MCASIGEITPKAVGQWEPEVRAAGTERIEGEITDLQAKLRARKKQDQ